MKIIKNGWDFFQDQILGMHWLKDLIGKLLVKAGLGEGRFPGEFLHFFLYDIIKIFVLLAVLIFVISYIQSYFPPERSRKIMGRFHGIWANLIGALLGTVTPFCSCSSIPIFMGFTSAGLPLGVTFSFLISSPMVDLGSLILLMSVFGGKIAFAYVIVGLVIAVIGGTIIETAAYGRPGSRFYPAGAECGGSFAVAYNSRPYGLCKKSGCGYRQKGSSVYRCRSHHRGSYPQSDPRAYRPKHSWKTDLVRRATGDSSRRSHVCGYFRNHPGCRKPAGKRCRTWNDSYRL